MNDKQFITFFLGVMGVLIIIFFAIFIIAQVVTPDISKKDTFTTNSVVSRIEPVGKLNYSNSNEKLQESNVKTSQVDPYNNGEEVYNSVCQSCHTAGILNSPKLGDKTAWQKRLEKGKDVLYANAIKGIGAMPAKGGRPDLSDKLIKLSVDYILESIK
tara:strand:+ start:683 stop:1156 length:474 start_codon:yes stop_codon:yes gene_type:complete